MMLFYGKQRSFPREKANQIDTHPIAGFLTLFAGGIHAVYHPFDTEIGHSAQKCDTYHDGYDFSASQVVGPHVAVRKSKSGEQNKLGSMLMD